MRPPPQMACRRKPSRALKARILTAQEGRCRACGRPLAPGCEFDHVVALALGGGNDAGNWAALCPPCHRSKTALDLKRIAKADRQRRFFETGKTRAPSAWTPPNLPPRAGFSRTLRRHMDGSVTARCDCLTCRRHRRDRHD